MTVKILTVVATVILNIAAAVFILFVLLLALNGYSESDTMWGLTAFAFLAIAVTLLSSIVAILFVRFLSTRNYRGLSSALISTITAVTLGAVLQLCACLISVLITEMVRNNF